MKCSVLQGESIMSPSLGETHRACSASPSGMWCLCSQLHFFFFFFLLQIFYPFKANSLSSGWGVLSREASEKAELVHQALSPLSRRSGLSSEQGWALLADKRTDVIVVVGESRCVPQKELGIPMPCGHNLIAAPIAKFWGLSVALSPYIVKKQNKTKFQVFKIFLIFSDRSLFTCIINHYLLR